MRILYLTQFLPLPLDHGGVIKTYSALRVLKKLGHEVIIFSYAVNKEHLNYCKILVKRGFRIGAVILNKDLTEENPQEKLKLFLQSIITLKPFSVFKFYTKKMEETVEKFLKKEKIDVFWVDNFTMAQYLPQNFTGLRILDSHNVESTFFKEMFLKDNFIKWRIFALLEWIKYKIYEKKYYPSFNKIIAISNNDKELITKITGRNDIVVLPPIITLTPIKSIMKTPNALLFIGSLCWYPNKDGIFWFLKSIYLKVSKEIPTIKFWVIGKLPRRFIFKKYKNVKFLGYKKSIKKYLKSAELFIVPIRYGSGIRIKILEAVANNLPVVSTYKGVEGLDTAIIKKIMIGKDENEIANLIINYFKKSRTINFLGRNPKKLLKNYSFDKSVKILKWLLKGLLYL